MLELNYLNHDCMPVQVICDMLLEKVAFLVMDYSALTSGDELNINGIFHRHN